MKGKASRATISRRYEQKVAKDRAFYERMMKSDLPFCPNCSNAWYIEFKREDWGASSGNWLCEAGRKRQATGGPCRYFSKGERKRVTVRPRDKFVAFGFRKAIELELEDFDFAGFTNKDGAK